MTQPASRSIVLRSSHILLVKVVAARPAAWAPFRPGLKSRKVELSVQVEEALRGLIDPAADRPVDVTVEQTAYDGELMMQPLQGSWSPVPIDPGTELVTFSESASGRAELVLEDGDRLSAELTREQVDELELEAGQIVYVRAARQREFA